MFNPYFSQVQDALLVPKNEGPGSIHQLFAGIGSLDGDKLLLLLLIFVLLQEGRQEERWPLVAALIYCMM